MLLFFSQLPLLLNRRWAFRSIAAGLFAQSPQGLCRFALAQAARALHFFARTKKRSKENSPSALFCLLRHFSPLNKQNSLTLKQLFVFHAPKSTSASRQKSEAGPYCFFATSLRSLGFDVSFFLRSLGVDVFLFCFARCLLVFFLTYNLFVILLIPLLKNQKRFSMSVANNEARRSEDLVYIPTTSEAMCPPMEGYFRPQWRSVKKNRVFSVKNEKLFERSEFFSFRKMRRFFSSGA